MTTIERDALAEALIETTLHLRHAIESGEPDALESLQSKRVVILKALFSDLDDADFSEGRWLELVRKVQVLNRELVELAQQARDKAGHELANLRRMRKAESNYSKIYEDTI
ncbi:flagellar protein FliT [Methyloterricola oryzae]|uniref:flagellar protein FliT n=1 Tax=Methyloterricola oryzae TaxID=1495050 RepID=UPI0005EB93C8|nr:flagellar protein FliT [Methyloterricola oryzae]